MDGRSMCALADQELASFLSASELETAHPRMCKQENKCGFGLKGLWLPAVFQGRAGSQRMQIGASAERRQTSLPPENSSVRWRLVPPLTCTSQSRLRCGLARMGGGEKAGFRARRPWSDWQTVCNSPMGTCITGFPHCQGRAGRSERLLRGPDAAMGSSDREGTPE